MDLLTNKNTVTLGGKEWSLSPLTVEDLGELQQWVYTKLEDPIAVAKEIVKDQPADIAKHILEIAYEDALRGDRKLGSIRANALLVTFEGFVEQTYLACRKNHPEMTRQSWSALFTEAVEKELEELRKKLGEKEGGAIPDPKVPSSSGKTADPSIGASTSATSPKGSASRRKKSAS